MTLVDNPWIVRGAASRLFDGEGLATRPMTVVEDGVLKTWILDTYSGRKLGLPSTRSAWGGMGSSPSPGTSNFWMHNGTESLEALIAGTKRGLLVTDTVGGGANTVTGDFSQGVVGLWIEDGKIAYPVEEITIASTLAAMWQAVDLRRSPPGPRDQRTVVPHRQDDGRGQVGDSGPARRRLTNQRVRACPRCA